MTALTRFRRPSFATLCALLALESVAANVVHPVEPAFYIGLGLPDWIFGAAFAAMAFGLFALAPFWGMVSDRVGRVPALVFTCVTYGFSQLGFCVSTTVEAIIFVRFLAGATCSGVGVAAMAYVADVSDERTCGRHMTIYVAVQNVATAAGFFLGGIVGRDDPRLSFILQFAILVVVAALAWLVLAEGPGFVRSQNKLTLAESNPVAAFADARTILSPWLVLFLASFFAANMASAAFDNSFNYYLRDQFSFPTTYNGYIYAVMGILGLAANLTLGLRLQRARDPERAIGVVLLCAGAFLAVTTAVSSMPVYLATNVVFYVFNSMYAPLMQSMVMVADPQGHGRVSGLYQSVRSLGMVAGSLAAGFVYEANAVAPFVMASCAFLLGTLLIAAARAVARKRGRVRDR